MVDPACCPEQVADVALVENMGDDRDLDEPLFGSGFVVLLVLELEPVNQGLTQFGVHFLIDAVAEIRVLGQVEEGKIGLTDFVGDHGDFGQQGLQLQQQEDGDLDRGGPATVELAPLFLEVADPVAFLHLSGEMPLVLRSEQVDASDLAEIHAHGVVDAFRLFVNALSTFLAHFDDAA